MKVQDQAVAEYHESATPKIESNANQPSILPFGALNVLA